MITIILDDPGDVRAGCSDQEAARLQQQPGVGEQRVGRPAGGDLRKTRSEAA